MQSQPKTEELSERATHVHYMLLKYEEHTHALQQYRAVLLFIQLLNCNFTAGLQKATVTMFCIVHTPCIQCLIIARLSRYVYFVCEAHHSKEMINIR